MHALQTSSSKAADHMLPSLNTSPCHFLFEDLAKLRLLISAIDGLRIRQTITSVELDAHRMIILPAIQTAALDTSNVGHDLQFCVERATAVGAKLLLDQQRFH